MRGQDLDFQVQAGADTQTLTLASGPNDTWSYSSTSTLTLGDSKIYTSPIGTSGQSGLVIDADPSINYGFGVTNGGTATQTYTFTFPMPTMALAVNLPPGTYNVSASFGDTLTASPGDTAQFSLHSGTTTYQQSLVDGTGCHRHHRSRRQQPRVGHGPGQRHQHAGLRVPHVGRHAHAELDRHDHEHHHDVRPVARRQRLFFGKLCSYRDA